MNPQEILPSPEIDDVQNTAESETSESVNEIESAKQVERRTGPSSGFGAVSAVAVDDAQSKVQGVMGAGVGSASVGSATNFTMPATADDLDLIEKEWVKKAKHIVAATMGDPYTQNKQINEMKVDYIKKRYNKDIKLRKE